MGRKASISEVIREKARNEQAIIPRLQSLKAVKTLSSVFLGLLTVTLVFKIIIHVLPDPNTSIFASLREFEWTLDLIVWLSVLGTFVCIRRITAITSQYSEDTGKYIERTENQRKRIQQTIASINEDLYLTQNAADIQHDEIIPTVESNQKQLEKIKYYIEKRLSPHIFDLIRRFHQQVADNAPLMIDLANIDLEETPDERELRNNEDVENDTASSENES